jgi:hypothetical protein
MRSQQVWTPGVLALDLARGLADCDLFVPGASDRWWWGLFVEGVRKEGVGRWVWGKPESWVSQRCVASC